MKIVKSTKKVIFDFQTEETNVVIRKITMLQSTDKESCDVSFSFFSEKEGRYSLIKEFNDTYNREHVNQLTELLIENKPAEIKGLFDLNEWLMLQISINIIDLKKGSNEYLGLSANDLEIVEE